jgi:hypothetical protein
MVISIGFDTRIFVVEFRSNIVSQVSGCNYLEAVRSSQRIQAKSSAGSAADN